MKTMYNGINPIKLTMTRFDGLAVANTNPAGKALWRFIDITDPESPAAIGYHYVTKTEIMADLDRFGKDFTGETK